MRRDDYKFIAGLIGAAALGGWLVHATYLRDLATQAPAGASVDLKLIEAKAQKGALSLHDAAHWEPVEDAP